MEQRSKTITEYKIYTLDLAHMAGGVDKSTTIAIFDDLQKLKDFYNSQLAEAPYKDESSADNFGQTHSWRKVFKKGSPLEWYNPAYSLEPISYLDRGFGGVGEQWVDFYPTRESINNSILFNPQ